MTTVTSSQTVSLLENVLFESATLAAANASTWMSNPAAAQGVSALAAAMLNSPEAGIPEEVIRLYEGVLGRVPGAQEIAYYTGLIDRQASAAQIAAGPSAIPQQVWNAIAADFAAAPEFQATGANIVQALYQNVLGRVPSADETSYYAAQIANGATSAQLVQDFVNSAEYQAKLGSWPGTLLGDYGIAVATNPSNPPASLTDAYLSITASGTSGVVYSGGGGSVTVNGSGAGTSTSTVTSVTSTLGTGSISLGTGTQSTGSPVINDSLAVGAGTSQNPHILTMVFESASSVQSTLFHFDDLADSFAGAAVDASHAVSQAQALDLAAAAAGTLAAGTAKLEWFQFGGNTYIVEVTNAGAASTHTALAATDYVVRLAGLVDLSTGSFNGGHNFTL